jgi:hypothetical protein
MTTSSSRRTHKDIDEMRNRRPNMSGKHGNDLFLMSQRLVCDFCRHEQFYAVSLLDPTFTIVPMLEVSLHLFELGSHLSWAQIPFTAPLLPVGFLKVHIQPDGPSRIRRPSSP